MIRETERSTVPGGVMLALVILALILFILGIIFTGRAIDAGTGSVPLLIVLIVLTALDSFAFGGFFVVNPNEAKVLQLFGSYVGTVKRPGLHWTNPLYSKKRISLRVRNFESQRLKVNDKEGNPIEIAAVVVWRVVDTAEASFEVDNYENYVHIQSEAAVRNLATGYPYDSHDEQIMSLRGQTQAIAEHMKTEIQERLAKAGVEVIEARISHLAYAPEIAGAMLQRQQAGAIIAARQRIVEGAVGMVEMALDMLSKKEIVHLDEERRAVMVSNLLVVLCGERGAQPVLNTGTLYQ
jgi:regulator of protease activity HflC (stomatin/prohibitin superfamily)